MTCVWHVIAAWQERLGADRLGSAGQSADVPMARSCQTQERTSTRTSWRLRRHSTASSRKQAARLTTAVH